MCSQFNRFISKNTACLIAAVSLSACVSDTLSVENTQATPQPLVQNVAQTNEDVSYDPVQRAQAIAEIRAKAENTSTPELTNAYSAADGPNQPLTAEEQAAKLAELNQTAEQNSSGISDAELEAKQRSIRELQAKGQSHYEKAVKSIQN